jgi:hypothetical protein
MTLEREMEFAIKDVKNFFLAEKLVLTTDNISMQYMAAKMLFRKAIDIFPELNTREPHQEVIPTLQQSRLVKK